MRESKTLKEEHPRIMELRGKLASLQAKTRKAVEGTLEDFDVSLRACREVRWAVRF